MYLRFRAVIKSFSYEAVQVMFATPAAIGILGKIDPRLDFLPIIEQIVVRYEEVSHRIIVAFLNYFNFSATFPSNVIAFTALLYLPLAVAVFRKPYSSEDYDILLKRMWQTLSMASLLSFSIIFEANEIFFTFFTPIVIVYAFFKIFGNGKNDETAIVVGSTAACLVMYIVSVTVMDARVFFYNRVGLAGFDHWVLIMMVSASIMLIFYTIKSPAYIALWVLGVIAVNWSGTVLVPNLNQFLFGEGAS